MKHRVIINDDERVLRWMLSQYSVHLNEMLTIPKCIGLEVSGELVCAIRFSNHYGNSIQVHLIWNIAHISRRFITIALGYAFLQLGVEHLFATIESENYRCLKIARHIGMVDVATIPNWFGDVGANIMLLSKDIGLSYMLLNRF